MKGKKRIFVCVELSDSDVDAVARTIELLQCQHPWKQLRNHTRWVNPRSSHLTLRFLGDMGDEEIETLRSKLDLELAALGNLEPFPLAAASLGTFQRKGLPSVLWLGLTNETTKKLQMVERCVRRAAGGEGEERFSPHITLARFSFKGREQDGRTLLRKLRTSSGEGGQQQEDFSKLISGKDGAILDYDVGLMGVVDRVCIMQSELSREGAKYTPLHILRWKGAADADGREAGGGREAAASSSLPPTPPD